MNFTYNGQPSCVIFDAGSLQHLARKIDLLGAKRALVLSTPERRASAEMIADLLGNKAAGVFDRAVMHVPIETACEARQMALALGADCAIAIGGGSTTGLGKAIALDSGLPILATPTTYAGSEMTPIYGILEGGLKKTGKDARVLPRTTIYDPDLSMSLPVSLSITSGINAIAHAAEGLYALDSNPIMDLMACEGIAALASAWLCGTVLGNVGKALGVRESNQTTAAQAKWGLAYSYGAPISLATIGLQESDLDKACDVAMQNQYANPRPLELVALRALFPDAFEGVRPR